jgi:hypothetical protein
MHVNTAINELKVKNYAYNDVKEILESITAVGTSKTRPTTLKKGDVFRAFTGKKNRFHTVIKVLNDVVIAIPMSTTEDCINLSSFNSRFFGENYFGTCLTTHCLEEAIENFAGVLEDNKSLNNAIKLIKDFVNKI